MFVNREIFELGVKLKIVGKLDQKVQIVLMTCDVSLSRMKDSFCISSVQLQALFLVKMQLYECLCKMWLGCLKHIIERLQIRELEHGSSELRKKELKGLESENKRGGR